MFRHRGREGFIGTPANRADGTAATHAFGTDFGQQYGGAYFKYNNGRFFLNAEYNFDRQSDVRSYSANLGTRNVTAINPAYVVSDSGAVELGALCGPAKITAIGAWYTGDDYRGGTLNGNNGMFRVTLGLQSDVYSNTGVFRPYSYLMVYGYGLGSVSQETPAMDSYRTLLFTAQDLTTPQRLTLTYLVVLHGRKDFPTAVSFGDV